MVEIKNKQIWIDGRPQMIMSGEIHYYRLAKEDWQDRIDKLKDAGFNAVASYIPWLCHEPVKGQFDFTGATRPELDLAGFIELCAANGLYFNHDYAYQLDVIKQIAAGFGIEGHLSSTNRDLSLVERAGAAESFIFIGNYDEIEQAGQIYENGQPLFDGEEIVLPPRSGALFVRNFELHPGLRIEYATVEITELQAGDDEVRLTVRPVGRSGTVSVRMTGKWSVNMPADRANGRLVFRKVSEAVTLKFNKVN